MTDECLKCGTRDRGLQEHHITPRAVGGSDRADNVALLCRRCHRFAPHPDLSDVVVNYRKLFSEYVGTRARPEYDILRFGLRAGEQLPAQTADAVGMFAVGADRGGTAPKGPGGIWITAALLAGYGEVKRLVDVDVIEREGLARLEEK